MLVFIIDPVAMCVMPLVVLKEVLTLCDIDASGMWWVATRETNGDEIVLLTWY